MKTNRLLLLILLACLALCAGCQPRNPLPNSVVAAHGDLDWHKDTAQEFLDGKNLAGAQVAANFAPAAWSRRHIHTGLTNTANYYFDQSKTTSGLDTDGANGIDLAMLFFYAGHGNPEAWSTLGNAATQSQMELADHLGGGLTRYYWQCSCEVFAHGGHTCSTNPMVYGCPGSFDGSNDSAAMRNVYQRWGPALGKDLRMACGGSTELWCHSGETNAIWNNYNNHHYYVSDAFIFGLQTYHADVVPLCLTLGGSSWMDTPLWDLEFTNAYNNAGATRYYLQYGSRFISTPLPKALLKIPRELPILYLAPMELPDPLRSIEFIEDGIWLNSIQALGKRGPEVRVNRLSGAVYTLGEAGGFSEGKGLSEAEYLDLAWRYLEGQGWGEKLVAAPLGASMRIQSVPVEKIQEGILEVQKNVIVTFKRQVEVDGMVVNVLGTGGEMRVQMNNDGSLLNAAKTWRQVIKAGPRLPLKTYEQALDEALEQIEAPKNYVLDSWNWGYLELDDNVAQGEMGVVFQFNFVPASAELLFDYPPRTIEVEGQVR